MINKGNIENYIVRTLGLSCEEKSNVRVSLPIYLKGRFDFCLMSIEGNDFLLPEPKRGLQLTASVICSSAENIRKQTGYETIVVLGCIDAETRRAMISRKESFIVPQKQIYVPKLGIILQERGLQNGKEKDSDALSPAAQRLILYHLQVQSMNGLALNHISDLLGYPAKTITQIVKELETKGLCEVMTQNRGKVLAFNAEGEDLWLKAYMYMQSPVKSICYVDDLEALRVAETAYTYDMALSHYTFIADSGKRAVAVYWRSEQAKGMVFNKHEGNVRVEMWKYPPIKIADSDYIDPLSLVLCFKDENDERVAAELNKLVDKILAK